MERPLSKCQFVAFGAGVLQCFILGGISILLRPLHESLYFRAGGIAIWMTSALALLLPVAFAFGMARYAGRHDKVAFITCAVPALVIFLTGYLLDINIWIESGMRHFMTGGCLGYVPPLDVLGQVKKMLPPAFGALLAGTIGIALHRLTGKNPPPVENKMEDHSHVFRWFLLVVASVLVAVPVAYALHVTAKNTPEARIAHAEKILTATNSTDTEKSHVLWDIRNLPGDRSTKLLRDAAQHQPSPVNVLAAAFLTGRGDISALPLLEPELMKSANWKSGGVSMDLGAMIGNIDNPAAIPILARLMNAPDAKTRQGAARSLRHTTSNGAIEPLIGGLYDEDWEVRWLSVLGLAEIVGSPKGERSRPPSRDSFQNNEQPCLAHWRKWAETRPGH